MKDGNIYFNKNKSISNDDRVFVEYFFQKNNLPKIFKIEKLHYNHSPISCPRNKTKLKKFQVIRQSNYLTSKEQIIIKLINEKALTNSSNYRKEIDRNNDIFDRIYYNLSEIKISNEKVLNSLLSDNQNEDILDLLKNNSFNGKQLNLNNYNQIQNMCINLENLWKSNKVVVSSFYKENV